MAAWAYSRATRLLAISQFQVENLKSFGIDLPCQVIPWGAEPVFTFEQKTRQQTLRILHVAHIAPVKDQTTLLKTFALVSNSVPSELRIVGGDTMQGALQQKASELDLAERISFLGMIPHGEMKQQYAWADILLHTSLFEGQSMAVTEGAASGLLLAGTRVGLLSDLGDSCGVVVKPGEYELLASKLLAVVNDPVEWNRKLAAAKDWSVKFNLQWTIDELSKVLQETGE